MYLNLSYVDKNRNLAKNTDQRIYFCLDTKHKLDLVFAFGKWAHIESRQKRKYMRLAYLVCSASDCANYAAYAKLGLAKSPFRKETKLATFEITLLLFIRVNYNFY